MNMQYKGIYELKNDILRRYANLGNWRAVGKDMGITSGMAFRVAVNGYEPHDPHIRSILNLPVLLPAPVCLKCGEVHVTKKCMKGVKPEPKSKWVRVLGHAGWEIV